MTSTVDGRDHLVSAPASAGQAAGHEKSMALCGRLVVAVALTVPPGTTYFERETALHRVTVGGNTSYRRRGLRARLLRRRSSRTGSRASGGAGVMRWCVASLADGDTHLADPGAPGQTVARRIHSHR